MALADSARAVPAPAASIAAVRQTAKPPADSRWHTNDSSFDPGKVSSSWKVPQASRTGGAGFAWKAPRGAIALRDLKLLGHHRRPERPN